MKHLHFRRLLFTAVCLLLGIISIQADDDLMTQQITITLDEAGTLPDKISDAEKHKITNLKIVGEINGTDLKLIRDMAGVGIDNKSTEGKLSILDLGESKIVSGGSNYFSRANPVKVDSIKSYTTNDEIGEFAFDSCNTLTSVILPSGVTSIGMNAFLNCRNLTSVTIPNSVTSIGLSAFFNCSSLTSVTIPSSVKSIGISAFQSCTSLASISIPNSVTAIGESAFYECENLTSVTIPNSVTRIENVTFWNCI